MEIFHLLSYQGHTVALKKSMQFLIVRINSPVNSENTS